jgi:hypothetical protein
MIWKRHWPLPSEKIAIGHFPLWLCEPVHSGRQNLRRTGALEPHPDSDRNETIRRFTRLPSDPRLGRKDRALAVSRDVISDASLQI